MDRRKAGGVGQAHEPEPVIDRAHSGDRLARDRHVKLVLIDGSFPPTVDRITFG